MALIDALEPGEELVITRGGESIAAISSTLRDRRWVERLTPEDRRGLSPLFWAHVYPYGRFRLDMDARLDVTAA